MHENRFQIVLCRVQYYSVCIIYSYTYVYTRFDNIFTSSQYEVFVCMHVWKMLMHLTFNWIVGWGGGV